jgi:hypothetical protein
MSSATKMPSDDMPFFSAANATAGIRASATAPSAIQTGSDRRRLSMLDKYAPLIPRVAITV